MAKVSVKNKSEEITPCGTIVEIDGKEIPKVRSVDFHVSTDEIPCFTFETIGMPDIEIQSRCDFRFDVTTVEQACEVLKREFRTNRDFYNAFVASIESALRESAIVWEEWEYEETAKKIADRIIGNETD
jgi:hypothetical protein